MIDSQDRVTASIIREKYYRKKQLKQLEISVGENLWLIVTKAGKCIFRYRVYITTNKIINGKLKKVRNWITIGSFPMTSLNEAKAACARFNEYKEKGTNPLEVARTSKTIGFTVGDLIKHYEDNELKLVRKAGSSLIKAESYTKLINSKIGDVVLNELTKDIIFSKLVQPKLEEGYLASAKSIFNFTKTLLKYALKVEKLKINPLANFNTSDIRMPRGADKATDSIGKPRERVLDESELRIVLNAIYREKIYTPIKIAIHLLLILGFRKSELLDLKWSNINLKDSMLSVYLEKVEKLHTTKLPSKVLELFKILHNMKVKNGSDFIFCVARKKTRMAYTLINKWLTVLFNSNDGKYKLKENITVHDLRRTFATTLSNLDYNQNHLEFQLGHALTGSKKHYYHAEYLEQRFVILQDWCDRLDSYIEEDLKPYGKSFDY